MGTWQFIILILVICYIGDRVIEILREILNELDDANRSIRHRSESDDD